MTSPYRADPDALGRLVCVHRNTSDRMLFGCLAVIAVIAGGAFVAVGFWLGLLADVIGIAVCGLVLLRRKGRAGHIARHELGLVQSAMGTTTTIPFDEVESITSDRSVSVRSGVQTELHHVRATDGRQITFTNVAFEDAGDLLAEIERHVLPRLRVEALRAFDEGKPVVFGPFSLDEEGIRAGDEPRLSWADVKGTKLDDGMLCLLGPGDRSLTQRGLSLVPNAPILVEMISLAAELASEPTAD